MPLSFLAASITNSIVSLLVSSYDGGLQHDRLDSESLVLELVARLETVLLFLCMTLHCADSLVLTAGMPVVGPTLADLDSWIFCH